MKKLILIFLFSSVLNEFCPAQEAIYKDVSCQEAYELIQGYTNDTNFMILDLRPTMMYNSKHIANAICVEASSENLDKFLKSLDKEKIYLIYCAIGKRSEKAFKKMKKQNFHTVYHLYQGLKEWNKQAYEVVSSEK